MARPGLLDTTAVPWGWFDKCGENQGWFDRDLLTWPVAVGPTPPPWYWTLLYQGGWDETSDKFFGMYDTALAAGVAWELGLGEYEAGVTFAAFEEKILAAERDDKKRDEFRQMIATFKAERLEKMKIVKRVVTVAGVMYVVWKLVALI